jgi:hydrophobic/amphiphilic exporter-1 (mainly G- bacteria), HAE1 family
MTTSFTFILGLLPRVGVGATSAVGTPIFGGMLAASVFGVFIVPMLYVVFRQLREQVAGHPAQMVEQAASKMGAPEAGE